MQSYVTAWTVRGVFVQLIPIMVPLRFYSQISHVMSAEEQKWPAVWRFIMDTIVSRDDVIELYVTPEHSEQHWYYTL